MDNRERYQHLLDEHEISQVKSAELLSLITQRPCSARAVRSWLNDPEKPSSRPCPDWAVAALESAIDYMKRAIARRQER